MRNLDKVNKNYEIMKEKYNEIDQVVKNLEKL
jgi:hypothetical protein